MFLVKLLFHRYFIERNRVLNIDSSNMTMQIRSKLFCRCEISYHENVTGLMSPENIYLQTWSK